MAIDPIGMRNEEQDTRRFQQLMDDPESGMHLLRLLSLGKGTQDDFCRMLDRIQNSKEAAKVQGKGFIYEGK